MDKPLLICTVGLPRSGKTTWASQITQTHGWAVVSPDAVRLAIHGQAYIQEAEPFVWATVETMVRALFLAGAEVLVLDACNVTRKSRARWKSERWATGFMEFFTPLEVCQERAYQTNPALLKVIDKMAREREPLELDDLVYGQAYFPGVS